MSLATDNNLTRTLEAGSCKIVGTQLKSRVEEYEHDGKKLEPKIKQEVERVLLRTDEINAFTREELAMTTVDTYTDRTISGFEANLNGIIKIYNASEIAPLSEVQQGRASAASLLHTTLFAEGLKFLNLKHRQQWLKLDEIKLALAKTESQAAIQTLGLAAELERVQYWIERYGQALGITRPETKSAETLHETITAWHTALKKLANQTHALYDDDANPEHVTLRKLLLAPYDDQANEERKTDRADRKAATLPKA